MKAIRAAVVEKNGFLHCAAPDEAVSGSGRNDNFIFLLDVGIGLVSMTPR
jgi:hypothetical protein